MAAPNVQEYLKARQLQILREKLGPGKGVPSPAMDYPVGDNAPRFPSGNEVSIPATDYYETRAPGNPNEGGNKNGPGGSAFPSFQEWLAQSGLGGADIPEGADYSSMVAGQYAPVIKHLRKGVKRTKREGRRTDKDLEDIFNTSSAYAQRTAKKITKSGNRMEDRMTKQAKGLASRTAGVAKAAYNRTEDEMVKLGLEEALPAALHDTREDLARNQVYQSGMANTRRASAEKQNQNWANFSRAQANNAQLAGGVARADLASQINDLVFGIRGQIAETKSEKANAMMQAQMQEDQMAQSAAAQEASMQSSLYGNYQGDIGQLVSAQQAAQEAAQGGREKKEPLDLEGWAAVGDEYRGYLKQSGQHSGAPKSNTAEALAWLKSNIGGLSTPAPYANPQADALRQLQEMWEQQGGGAGTQIPLDALQQMMPSLFKQGIL